jgi:N-acetyl-anhydromuramyl-L-alanine amidase AmpD
MPTKDFTSGRRGKKLQYIIMHWGVTNKLSQIDAEVLSPTREMSYHYALSGITVHQYVKQENTAWHAQNFDANCRSIGICINASPTNPYSDRDYETASQLIADIFKRHGRLEIKGHRDFYATACPGNIDFGRIERRINEIFALYSSTSFRRFSVCTASRNCIGKYC